MVSVSGLNISTPIWLLSHEQDVMQEEKKTLERELARIKVSASRMATVVANEWKDEGDKVMPIKQWIEERKFLQVLLGLMRNAFVCSMEYLIA